jgi:DNA-binding IclR family transcriptional regulator
MPSSARPVHSVGKAIQILELLERYPGSLGVVEIGRRLRLHKSTVSRLLATMARHDLVARDEASGAFRLGSALIAFGSTALRQFDIRAVARPALQRLAQRTRETVELGVLENGRLVEIDVILSPQAISHRGLLGRSYHAHCTALGKAILADLPAGECRRLLGQRLQRCTPRTITEWERLEAELAGVRRLGYAVNAEELEPGLVSVAAPIYRADGHVAAAISVSGPLFRFPAARIKEYGHHVREAAGSASLVLGHRSGSAAV